MVSMIRTVCQTVEDFIRDGKHGKRAVLWASEMETAALFIVSMIRGVRAGAIMAYGSMNDHTIELACDAIKILIEEDKKKAGK